MDNLDECADEFIANVNWDDYEGTSECDFKMIAAAHIFACAA